MKTGYTIETSSEGNVVYLPWVRRYFLKMYIDVDWLGNYTHDLDKDFCMRCYTVIQAEEFIDEYRKKIKTYTPKKFPTYTYKNVKYP